MHYGEKTAKGLFHITIKMFIYESRKHAPLMVNSLRLLARFLLLFVNHMI